MSPTGPHSGPVALGELPPSRRYRQMVGRQAEIPNLLDGWSAGPHRDRLALQASDAAVIMTLRSLQPSPPHA